MQRVWTSLSAKLQSEEQSVRIVALWDGFAQEEQMRCCKIIVSIEGSSARDCFCSARSRADKYKYDILYDILYIIYITVFHILRK